MPRLAARTDSNQKEIVEALRKAGWHVAITSQLGGGFPDLVVSKGGWMAYVEVKDGSLPPSKQRLTKDEAEFQDACRGPYYIVTNPHWAVTQLEGGLENYIDGTMD